MKPDKFLLELEQILEQAGYTLRKERGSFRGDECIMEGNKLVVVNKNKPLQSQIGTMARVLAQVNITGVYIKPAVRKQLDELWDRLSVSPIEDEEEFGLE